MRPPEPRPGASVLEVTGGSAGLAARYAGMRRLAEEFEAAAGRLAELGWADVGSGADTGLLVTAPFSPITFADAQTAIIAAAGSLAAAAALWEADAMLVRAAVGRLELSDVAAQAAMDELDRRLGVVTGITLRAGGPLLLAAAHELPPGVRRRLDDRLQGWMVDHPDVVQHLINGGGGLVNF